MLSQSATSISTKASAAKMEPFYISSKDNVKGTVYRQYPQPKSIRKTIPIVAITDKEENLTTKDVNSPYS